MTTVDRIEKAVTVLYQGSLGSIDYRDLVRRLRAGQRVTANELTKLRRELEGERVSAAYRTGYAPGQHQMWQDALSALSLLA